MSKRVSRLISDPQAQEKIAEFRQELDEQIDQAIDHHEFKMVYIGIATLVIFAGVIFAAWKF
ncbi:hypothetical protein [Leptolyngbya ohadii]|uniref:hypothetical protein n=1 Tax=Leptolyngbya ohadii TaxID=1962290 RepID=UPI000B599EC9|nr:hypothetical protein [Leptolyngbya ohadii]